MGAKKTFAADDQLRKTLAGFPPKFEQLRAVYAGQVFHPELQRGTISDYLTHALRNRDVATLEAALNDKALLPLPSYRQRLFYWSAICFYRAFYLFACYLRLDRAAFGSWAHVTGYYSKFYLLKAVVTLFQTTFVVFSEDKHGRKDTLLVCYGVQGVQVLDSKLQKTTGVPRGSHQQWWWLFEQLVDVNDWPSSVASIMPHVLSDTYFGPQQRNQVNYSDVFHEGFNELEWCDVTPEAMLSKLAQERPRLDRDITAADEFFAGLNPEVVDEADFYQDDAVNLWTDLRTYLALVEALGIRQSLLTREKIKILVRRFIEAELPNIAAGLHREIKALDLHEEPHPL